MKTRPANGQTSLSEHQDQVKSLSGTEKGHPTLFEHTQIAICLVTFNGNLLAVNTSLCRLLGYTSEETFQLNIKDLWANPEEGMHLMQSWVEQEVVQVNRIRLKRRDGGVITVNLTGSWFMQQDQKVILVMVEDITTHQRKEQLQRLQKDLIIKLAKTNQLHEALTDVLNTILRIEGIDCGGIYIVDAVTHALRLVDHCGVGAAFVEAVGEILPATFEAQIVFEGKMVFEKLPVTKLTSSSAYQMEAIRSTMLLPIKHGDHIGSVLVLASHSLETIDEDTRETLETIIRHIEGLLDRIERDTALQISEKRFRTLAAISPDGIFYTDASGKGLYFNQRWCEISGLSLQEALGKGWQSTIHSADWPLVQNEWVKAYRDGTPFKMEFRIRQMETPRWVLGQAFPEKDQNGKVAGFVGTLADITERKIFEEELRFRNLLFTTLQETALDGILVIDKQRRILYTNRRFVELWNIPAEILASKSDQSAIQFVLDKLVDPISFMQLVNALYALRTQNSRDEICLKDGRTFDRYSAPVLDEDGQYYSRVWYFRDITVRKQAEAEIRRLNQELEERVTTRTNQLAQTNQLLTEKIDELERVQAILLQSETRYRVVADNTYGWEYWRSAADGEYFYISPSCERITGYSPQEFIQDPALVNRIIHPDDQIMLKQHNSRVAESETACHLEYRIIRRDGAVRWIEHVCQPVYSQDDNYLGWRGSNQDITGRKQIEEKVNRQAIRAEALAHMAVRLNSRLELGDLLQIICEESAHVFDVQITSIFLYNEQNQLFEYTADYGFPADIRGQLKPWTPGLISDNEITSPEMIIHDEQALNRLPNGALCKKLGIRSAIRNLMVHQDHPIGFLSLYFLDRSNLDLTKEDREVLSSLTDQATRAIINARLSGQIQEMMQNLEYRVSERTHELTTLYEISTIANQSPGQQSFLEHALKTILNAFHCQSGMILLFPGDNLKTSLKKEMVIFRGLPEEVVDGLGETFINQSGVYEWIQDEGQVLFIDDLKSDRRINLSSATINTFNQHNLHAFLGAPLRLSGDSLGVMGIFGGARRHFTIYEIAMMTNLADQIGLGIGTILLHEHAKHALVNNERSRLARELHDSTTQLLYSLSLMAETASRLGNAGKYAEAQTYLLQVSDIAQQALKEMRRMIYEMQPLALLETGILQTLQQRLETVERRLGIDARLIVDDPDNMLGDGWFADVMMEDIFRIIIEALNNALKYASTTQVEVSLTCQPDQMDIKIRDYGKGFDVISPKRGIGLKTMQERAERLGGTLRVTSHPGEGSEIHLGIPITEEA